MIETEERLGHTVVVQSDITAEGGCQRGPAWRHLSSKDLRRPQLAIESRLEGRNRFSPARVEKSVHSLNAGETGMTSPRSMLRTAVLLAPLSALSLNLAANSAQAADVVTTLKDQEQFSTLAKAIDSAGLAESLQGAGPYTLFAPTDEAFAQLPQGALESLMKQENQGQLKTLLQYHVVEGEEIAAKDATGKQTDVDTVSGESLSVDGSGQMVLVGPGDQPGTKVTEGSDMPASEHQQQVLAEDPATEQQQTMPQDSGMPSSPHQEQVLKGQQPGEQQASASGSQGATVVEPDIQADNGVIHGIDAVLVPQSLRSTIAQGRQS
jgi:uncharacterized surface protein with fasciclin (FAS1) repeats